MPRGPTEATRSSQEPLSHPGAHTGQKCSLTWNPDCSVQGSFAVSGENRRIILRHLLTHLKGFNYMQYREFFLVNCTTLKINDLHPRQSYHERDLLPQGALSKWGLAMQAPPSPPCKLSEVRHQPSHNASVHHEENFPEQATKTGFKMAQTQPWLFENVYGGKKRMERSQNDRHCCAAMGTCWSYW